MQNKLILLLLFGLYNCTTFSQTLENYRLSLPITRFTTQDGLPSNETYDVFIDDKKYIWVATDKGVGRFNGYEFINYTTADGLIDNTIFEIFKRMMEKFGF